MRIFCWGIHCVGGSQLYMQSNELFMFKMAKLGEKKMKNKTLLAVAGDIVAAAGGNADVHGI